MNASHTSLIEDQLAPLRDRLTAHKLYNNLSDISDIRLFMKKHVYAVWDFMSLLKALQNHLSCTSLPWKPSKNAKTARFINEIVWGEETDLNEHGRPTSHFEMYIAAMNEIGINTWPVDQFINSIGPIEHISDTIADSNLSPAVQEFLTFTFDVIKTNEPHKIAAAFTFGREDLIPDMFLQIIGTGNMVYPKLSYYLNRHIEVDGDEHGPLSLEMIEELCGNSDSKWNDVLAIAQEALLKRIKLWDEISDDIAKSKHNYQKSLSQDLHNRMSLA